MRLITYRFTHSMAVNTTFQNQTGCQLWNEGLCVCTELSANIPLAKCDVINLPDLC